MFACLFLFMGAPSGQGANPLAMWLPIILLFVIVYLLVLRPLAKRRKMERDTVNTGLLTSIDVSTKLSQPTPTKLLDRLWHAEVGFEIKSLVDGISPNEANNLVASIDLTNVPLNAFCTDSFNFKGLDDRMVATIILAFSLLETGKNFALMPLLDKIAEKLRKKLMIGSSRKGPSFESNDPWLIGESLMLRMHGLAMELLKKPDTKMYHYSILILETTLLDYPDRLESRFWLAAAWNNIYLATKDQDSKERALQAIDSFLTTAEEHADYQEKVEIFKKIRSTKY